MRLARSLLSQAQKNKKNPPRKKFLIFQKLKFLIFRKTELSNHKTKEFQEVTFRAQKNKKNTLKKFLIFQKMELSRPKLKNLLIFQEELPKTNKKSVLKKFLVSCDVFVIFTAINHREIPCEAACSTEI